MTATPYNAFYKMQFDKMQLLQSQRDVLRNIRTNVKEISVVIAGTQVESSCDGQSFQRWHKCFQVLSRLEDWVLADTFSAKDEFQDDEYDSLCEKCLGEIGGRKELAPPVSELFAQLKKQFPQSNDWDERAAFFIDVQTTKAQLLKMACAHTTEA